MSSIDHQEDIDRYKAENQWKAASAFIKSTQIALKAKRAQASAAYEEAWKRVLKKYPHKELWGEAGTQEKVEEKAEVEDGGNTSAVAEVEGASGDSAPADLSHIPLELLPVRPVTPEHDPTKGLRRHPWGDLPQEVELVKELKWVHGNALLVIDSYDPANPKYNLFRALSPAPSWGALRWLHCLARDPRWFNANILKAVAEEKTEDEGDVEERMSIERIEKMLEEME